MNVVKVWWNLRELSQLRQLKRFWKDNPNSPETFQAYKYVISSDDGSPIQTNGRIIYKSGETITVESYSSNDYVGCASGINVATLMWCLNQVGATFFEKDKSGILLPTCYRLIKLECRVCNIVAIPKYTGGKFRMKKVFVI